MKPPLPQRHRDPAPNRLGLRLGTRLAAVLVAAVPCVWLGTSLAQKGQAPSTPASPAAQRFPVQIHVPETIGTLDSGLKTLTGAPIGVTCGTCHKQHGEPPFAEKTSDLKLFHKDLQLAHGDLRCAACHSLQDRDRLHLADGREIPFQEVVTLCSQCHGQQARDYRNGAHGGMNGFWDLKRGPRVRNSCVDCHSAHAPAYPQVAPVHKPRDRFLDPQVH